MHIVHIFGVEKNPYALKKKIIKDPMTQSHLNHEACSSVSISKQILWLWFKRYTDCCAKINIKNSLSNMWLTKHGTDVIQKTLKFTNGIFYTKVFLVKISRRKMLISLINSSRSQKQNIHMKAKQMYVTSISIYKGIQWIHDLKTIDNIA